MNGRAKRYVEALTYDWHDATCPDGKDCRSRWVHSRGLSWPATLAKVIEQGAIIAVADAELAEQDQSWSLFHTDTTRALEAAEAEVERLRELIMQADWSVEQSQVSIAKLARQVESAEAKAADYHEEILAAHAAMEKVREFAAVVRSHPPVTPTTTGEEMLSIRLQRWFADDLEAILDAEPDAPVPAKTWVMPSPDQVRKAPRRPAHDTDSDATLRALARRTRHVRGPLGAILDPPTH